MSNDVWDVELLRGNPVFRAVCTTFELEKFKRWPTCDDYNAWLDDVATPQDKPLRFVQQTSATTPLRYEEIIFHEGLVPTRPGWHDFFNAVTWALFPKSKAEIYAAHARLMTTGREHRGRQRDALTLFDECGIIIATTDERYKQFHRSHDWRNLFVKHRCRWWHELSAVIFGHGLYQQCLTPYMGLTGKTLYITVEPEWFSLGYREACLALDKQLAKWLGVLLRSPAQLLPLPVLGVPLWHADNSDETFYNDRSYFRAAKRY